MKTCSLRVALALTSLLGSSLAIAGEVIRLSEPVATTATHEIFGARMPQVETTYALADLVAEADKFLEQDVVVTTRIAKVCQKKGCFFVATDGATTARVTFKDYGFFIPTDSGGKTVSLAGRFDRKPLSAADAKHYAKDLGEAPPDAAPRYEYVIVATAVSIPKDG